MGASQLQKSLGFAKAQTQRKLQENLKTLLTDFRRGIELLEDFSTSIDEEFQTILEKNEEASFETCEVVKNTIQKEIKNQKSFERAEELKETLLNFRVGLDLQLKTYEEHAKGPSRCRAS